MALLKKKHSDTSSEEKKQSSRDRGAKKRFLSKREGAVLLRPVVTEKSAAMGTEKAVFFIPISANKIEVANAIEGVYGVRPVSINTVRIAGKFKRNKFARSLGKRSDMKKAIVTLPQGAHIDVFENV